MKSKLVFDVTDANTIADSDSVGAFLRSSDGTLITHSTVGGKEALDVSIADGVNVEVDLSHVDDSVRLGDGTNFLTSTSENGDVALDVHISNTSVEVTATDLDIRNLTFATDKVDASGSTLGANDGVDIGDVTINNAAGASAVNIQDGGNSITVDATDLDIRDLTQATDSVSIGDGTTLFDVAAQDAAAGAGHAGFASMAVRDDVLTTLTEVDGDFTHLRTTDQGALWTYIAGSDPLTINDAALANTAIASASNNLDVANTAEDVVTSPLVNRKYLYIYNNGNRTAYIGATGVSAANGYPLSTGSELMLRAGASVDIEWVSDNTSQQLRTLELS